MTRYVIKFEIDVDDEEFAPDDVQYKAEAMSHELGNQLSCMMSENERETLVSSQTREDYIKERKMLFVGRPEERD